MSQDAEYPSSTASASLPSSDAANARKVLDARLRTDEEFDAFCIDCFRDAYHRFTRGMDRIAKVNLLLTLYEPETILEKLRNRPARMLHGTYQVAPNRPASHLVVAVALGVVGFGVVTFLVINLFFRRSDQTSALTLMASRPAQLPRESERNSQEAALPAALVAPHPGESRVDESGKQDAQVDGPSATKTATQGLRNAPPTIEDAQKQYDLNHFHEAMQIANDTYLHTQNWEALFLLAQSHRKLGNHKVAKFFYETYLSKPNIKNKKQATDRLRDVKNLLTREEMLKRITEEIDLKPID